MNINGEMQTFSNIRGDEDEHFPQNKLYTNATYK
jgi:hypothetical protein